MLPMIPKPSVPDSSDGVGWLEKLSDSVSHMSGDTMKLIVIGLLAAIIVWLFRRSPMLKGVAIGVVVVAIVLAIAT